MKKILPVLALSLVGFATFAAPTKKVLEAFTKTYENIINVNWHEYDMKYEAKFDNNNVQYSVLYDEEGNVLKCTRYYGGEKLPLSFHVKLLDHIIISEDGYLSLREKGMV